ncbi:hypothetical protein DPMN_186707 [Dreissena polymorpha]|uniref:Uncharacterized protein n=1 Tax=Dreissena polymorpha TaxID=45954 RepID=A0A9D4I9T7_DREPO|nr:hypothetical protein DPMN_186707 [Dreissena polymorpha]
MTLLSGHWWRTFGGYVLSQTSVSVQPKNLRNISTGSHVVNNVGVTSIAETSVVPII